MWPLWPPQTLPSSRRRPAGTRHPFGCWRPSMTRSARSWWKTTIWCTSQMTTDWRLTSGLRESHGYSRLRRNRSPQSSPSLYGCYKSWLVMTTGWFGIPPWLRKPPHYDYYDFITIYHQVYYIYIYIHIPHYHLLFRKASRCWNEPSVDDAVMMAGSETAEWLWRDAKRGVAPTKSHENSITQIKSPR